MRRGGMVAGMLLADVMMIVTAFALGASEVPVIKWIWFFLYFAAFLGVY